MTATAANLPRDNGWTPARLFLLVTTIIHIPLGIIGFFYDRSFPIGPEATEAAGSAQVFGILETNGWHTLGALIVGLAALYGMLARDRARPTALALGVTHIGLFFSLIIFEPSTFWLASNDADQVIHAFTAVGGTVTGLMTKRPALAPGSNTA